MGIAWKAVRIVWFLVIGWWLGAILWLSGAILGASIVGILPGYKLMDSAYAWATLDFS